MSLISTGLFPIKTVLNDALPIIERFAPTLAGSLGGLPGLGVAVVIPLIAKAFGCDSRNVGDLVAKIINDKDAPLKLSALEEEHKDWVASIMHSVNNLSSADVSIKLEWKH